ncbi:hypothetical protein HPB50_019131 [Hyalomma asiaticum]|uniref:Uncharacterized protein n=1 Tax=Hyalomma asiaticum TaxID=266040 RepID=A0ACB7SMR4_HYAAI|nr:hypothetical protein HPB50_019131 [Hyalomma asiaticum]
MLSLNLDLLNETRLAAVSPVEMMVRGSLDLGIEAVISINFDMMEFVSNKRAMQIEYSKQQDIWRAQQRSMGDYILFLQLYGALPPVDIQLALKIREYDKEHEWVEFISKYTNGTYTGSDTISTDFRATTILEKLFESVSVGRQGLRYLVAWTFFRQLVELTEQRMFLRGKPASEACYHHIKRVMNLAVISPYFEEGPYPDAPRDRLFPTWIKALSLSAHYNWTDQSAPLYDESEVNAHYLVNYNVVIIPTALMHDPFMYPYGPNALHYGGIGTVIGHELMHAFDVAGIESIKRRLMYNEVWLFREFKEEYTKRALCLRQSHKSVLSFGGRQEILNQTLDAENLADLVAAKIAYAAFDSLPAKYRNITLTRFRASPEQLFFINHCVRNCAHRSRLAENYAPYRSRCIVPLMNMPEFSDAFRCAPGTPMNPIHKCNLW